MKNNTKVKNLLINPKKESLSPDKLRELLGQADLTDEKAHEIISSIRLFAKVLFGVMKERFSNPQSGSETPVIYLSKDKAA